MLYFLRSAHDNSHPQLAQCRPVQQLGASICEASTQGTVLAPGCGLPAPDCTCPASAVSTHRGVSHPLSSANSYWPSDTRPMCQPGARASPATAQGAHRSRRHRGGLGVDTVDMLGTGVKVEWVVVTGEIRRSQESSHGDCPLPGLLITLTPSQLRGLIRAQGDK